MKTLKTALLLATALTLAGAAKADHYADFYVIPAAAHAPGANNTNFATDVAIHNFQALPLTVELVFVEAGEANMNNVFPLTGSTVDGSVTISGMGSVLLRDVLAGYPAGNVTGAILIGADAPFAVSSRTYNNSAAGTYGQSVTPFRDFLEDSLGNTDNTSAVAYIPGIVANASYRTNLGLVAANVSGSDSNLVVRFAIRNAAGQEIGNRSVVVPAGSIMQLQFSSQSLTNTPFDAATAEVRIVEGDGAVVPYASVLDNRSGDGVFIAGQFPANATFGPSGKAAQRSIFRTIFDQVRSTH